MSNEYLGVMRAAFDDELEKIAAAQAAAKGAKSALGRYWKPAALVGATAAGTVGAQRAAKDWDTGRKARLHARRMGGY